MSHHGTQTRAGGSEFRSTSTKSRRGNVRACDLRARKRASLLPGSRRLVSLAKSPTSGSVRDPASKPKISREESQANSWPPHLHTRAHAPARTCTHHIHSSINNKMKLQKPVTPRLMHPPHARNLLVSHPGVDLCRHRRTLSYPPCLHNQGNGTREPETQTWKPML